MIRAGFQLRNGLAKQALAMASSGYSYVSLTVALALALARAMALARFSCSTRHCLAQVRCLSLLFIFGKLCSNAQRLLPILASLCLCVFVCVCARPQWAAA